MTPDSAQQEITALYQTLLQSWNRRSAVDFASLFTEDGNVVGFDGSQMNGRMEIDYTLGKIFADRPTSEYVGIVREVRLLSPDVALLRAVAGMVPRGTAEINPAVNTIQSLVAIKSDGQWRIAHYQNTPAAFHGRPEASAKLTEELQQALQTIDN